MGWEGRERRREREWEMGTCSMGSRGIDAPALDPTEVLPIVCLFNSFH